jgi:putative transposase
MSKLTNRDIQRIIRQWVRKKPVVETARDFQVNRQRVYQLITHFKDRRDYPGIKRSGRKYQPIDEKTEELILQTYRANDVGPTHLENKIEEIYGISHSP